MTGDGAAQAVWWRREAARVAEAMNVKDVGERRWRDDGETMMCVKGEQWQEGGDAKKQNKVCSRIASVVSAAVQVPKIDDEGKKGQRARRG